MTGLKKIDSNITGLRIAEEASIGVLPGSPVWFPYEPNTYADLGGETTITKRETINANRQRQKGAATDLDADGGFNTDMSSENLKRVLQGFFFADLRDHLDTQGPNVTAVTDIAVASNAFTSAAFGVAAGRKAVLANSLVYSSGWALAANNGLKLITGSPSDTSIPSSGGGLSNESTNAAARLQVVGYQFASATVNIVNPGAGTGLPYISRASGSVDFTTLGLLPGDWVWIGGDTGGTSFVTTANNGWARVREVVATKITFDKTAALMVAETGTGLTVQIFFGALLKNELGAAIKRRTYQIERSLGAPDDASPSAVQGEYLIGSVANELTFNFGTADKVTVDLGFVSLSHATVSAGTGLKAGTRPDLVQQDVFNTTSHVKRAFLGKSVANSAAEAAMFGYSTEFSLTISNNASVNKGIGVMGGFEITVGDFTVEGDLTAYFTTVAAISSIRANDDVTFDFAMVQGNKGVTFDVALLSLGGGKLNVEKDAAIMLPVTLDAAAHPVLNYTLAACFFPYLPTAAA